MLGSGRPTAADRLAARLTRRTSGGRWIPEIDGLRFVAITLVLASHVGTTLSLATHRTVIADRPFGDTLVAPGGDFFTEVIRHGSVGVHVFFMISGFVLALPFISHRHGDGGRVDIGRYFRRRITRIEPPYLIVMALLFVGSWVAGTHVGLGHLAASAAYVHGPLLGSLSPLNGVAWSLEVEVQFYVLVPALALILCAGSRLVRRQTILLLVVSTIALQMAGFISTTHSVAFLGSFLQFFLLGWLLADIFVVDWRGSPTTRRGWDFVSLALLPVLLIGLASVGMFEQAIAPWVVFAIGYCAFCGPTTRRLLSNRWVAIVGGMCYSIYLIHYPMFILLQRVVSPIARLPEPLALVGAFLLLAPIAVIVGALFFVTVERPCMDPLWFDRLVARLKRSRVGWPRSRARHVEQPSGAPSVDQEPIPAGFAMNRAES
jgi:peptidoglycan/LPS O-acetylase OafA/YrhL